MAGAGYKTFTAGSVLTASDVNTYLMQQAVMVFTNEAARDAAITSPSEGMIAYLTAPTVPAATGATTMIPTGAKTIYNGSVWVCVTPVSAFTSNTGTTSSTSFTATLGGTPGTNPTVTLVTGTTALISVKGFATNGVSGGQAFISVAVSGAGAVSASNDYSGYGDIADGSQYQTLASTFVLSGLTAGTNTFTLQYRVGSNTGTFTSRHLTVNGIA